MIFSAFYLSVSVEIYRIKQLKSKKQANKRQHAQNQNMLIKKYKELKYKISQNLVDEKYSISFLHCHCLFFPL